MKSFVTHVAKFSLILLCLFLFRGAPVSAAARDITPDAVLSVINQTRVQNGLPALSNNTKLAVAAENKGKNMQTYGYWAHTNPKTNETGWMFIQETGYQYTNAGENLAKDYTSVENVIHGWLNSPTHKSVLLSEKYSETGIGVLYYMQNGVEKALVVQLFASPLAKKQTLRTSFDLAIANLLNTITL